MTAKPPRFGSHFTTLLLPRERALLERVRVAHGAPHLSGVLNDALHSFLAGRDFLASPLPLPSRREQRLVSTGIRLPVATRRLMREVERAHGYVAHQIVRAALHELEVRFAAEQGRPPRRRRGEAQGPTHAGR